MQTKVNLQDVFLLRVRRDKIPVTVFLMNGFQMRGTITGYDAFVVILDSEGRQQVIYKHAISTIAPLRNVELSAEQKQKVEQKLLQQTSYESFEVTYEVDASLIGGMVIRIGDRVVDSSIKTKLEDIARSLKNVQLA